VPGQEGIGAAGGPPAKDNGAKDGSAKSLLPEAKLYATWDYETKDFRVPIAPSARPTTRSRMGSLNTQSAAAAGGGGTGLISLPVASSRGKVAK
jgi:Wiskott-Aldrich syndrome protein